MGCNYNSNLFDNNNAIMERHFQASHLQNAIPYVFSRGKVNKERKKERELCFHLLLKHLFLQMTDSLVFLK